MAIGASMLGIRTIITSQRIDFITLAMDQLLMVLQNGIICWWKIKHSNSIKIDSRKRLGAGSNALTKFSLFIFRIPGLKVVMPTFPNDTKSLLINSIEDNNPVIFTTKMDT